jgi:RNA polymerase sigma factor for flagellar operon FliA
MPRTPKADKADPKAKATKANANSGTSGTAKTVKATKQDGQATAVKVRGRDPAQTEGADELTRLWDEFKQSEASGARDSARERLILHYAPLVKYVASRVATGLPASVDQADLVSYGMFGLIDALEKFEPARGNKFETYAIPRIKGAIIDELRAMDWVPSCTRSSTRSRSSRSCSSTRS